MTVQYISKSLNVNPETVRRWIRGGELHGVQNGERGDYEITPDALNAFLDTHPKYKMTGNFKTEDEKWDTVLSQIQNRLLVLEQINQNLEQQQAFVKREISDVKDLLLLIERGRCG